MDDKLLGRLSKYANLLGVLRGSFAHGGRQIALLLVPRHAPLPQCLVLATAIVLDITKIDERAKGAATDDMLDLYNENWREYGQVDEDGECVEISNPELTKDQFKSRLTLMEVSIDGDQSVSLSYGNAICFWGHKIILTSVSPACRNFYVELYG